MNETIRWLVINGLFFALGMGVGQFITFRRRGRLLVVEIEAKEVWEKVVKEVAWIVVIVVFLASIAQSVLFTYNQRQCNADVVEQLRFRATVTSELQDLDDQTSLALEQLVKSILAANTTPNPGETVRTALEKHSATTQKLRKETEEKRKLRNEAQLPDCR